MLRVNEDLKEKKKQTKKQVTCLKRRKTRVTKSLLVLVLIVIDWEGGAISLEQSQNEVKFLITLLLYRNFIKRARKKIKGQQWFLKGCNRGIQQKITDLVDYCNFIETEFTSSMVKFTEENDRPADPRHTSRG